MLFRSAVHLGDAPPVAGDVLSTSARLIMQEPQIAGDGPGWWHGTGWFLYDIGSHRVVEHEGSYGGYETILTMVPARRIAIVVLVNSEQGHHACRAIRDRGLEIVTGERVPRPTFVSVSDEDLAGLAGSYDHPGYDELTVRVSGSALTVERRWTERGRGEVQDTLVLRPISPTAFIVPDGPFTDWGLAFLPDDDGYRGVIRFGGELGRRRS